jgi:hypothetical protein
LKRLPNDDHHGNSQVAVPVDAARAARAALVPLGIEHVVVDEELTAALEEVEQGGLTAGPSKR